MPYIIFFLLLIISQPSFGQTDIEKLDAQLQKGIEAFESGKYAKAERLFDKILAAEPSYASVYVWKGKCLTEFEEYQAAYEAFSTAKNLDPTHAPYTLEIAKFKYNLGITSIRKPELCGDCGKFLLPDNSQMLTAIGYYELAAEDCESALKLDPNYAEAYYQLALCYDALNNKGLACKNLSEALKREHSKAQELHKKICP